MPIKTNWDEIILTVVFIGFWFFVIMIIPLILTGVLRLLKRMVPALSDLKPRKVFISILVIQFLIPISLSICPVVTYDKSISEQVKQNFPVRSILRTYSGPYSFVMPLVPYKFHVVELTNSKIRALVYYPFIYGTMEVEWDDGCYNINQPLF